LVVETTAAVDLRGNEIKSNETTQRFGFGFAGFVGFVPVIIEPKKILFWELRREQQRGGSGTWFPCCVCVCR